MKIILSTIVVFALSFSSSLILAKRTDLPSRKASLILPILQKVSEKEKYSKVEKILGKPDSDIGSGIHIYSFTLNDNTHVIVGTPDKNEVLYIHHMDKNNKNKNIIYEKRK